MAFDRRCFMYSYAALLFLRVGMATLLASLLVLLPALRLGIA
jgi:hypothetical protein